MEPDSTLRQAHNVAPPSSPSPADRLWYKDAVMYQLHVKAFSDSNADGIGDFPGLTEKLDYLQELGVSCLWLLPFYPSPARDDGYDVSGYCDVHPAYGTLDDFKAFLAAAHAHGMHVIIELALNHTSDQHPWFQRARKAPPGSPARNFYVWSNTDKARPRSTTGAVAVEIERANWTWDEEAQAYYWHRFFHHQPDLNYENPEVLREMLAVLDFWLDIGVDGFRLDALPYLVEREGAPSENLPETHAILKAMRRHVDARYANRVLLAGTNEAPREARAYFGEGDEAHLAPLVPLMPRAFLALQLEDRQPIAEILDRTPPIPRTCQWAVFLRSHDELALDLSSPDERDNLRRASAAEMSGRQQIGTRRRLAPLLGNDRRRIEVLTSILFSLPGTPVMYYGDEIGMGDNPFLGDRDGVRTPMQWTGDRNAGFSRADPARLYAPLLMDPVYGYRSVNVEAQQRDPAALVHWVRNMIGLRRLFPVLSRGTIELLAPENQRVLAYLRLHDGDAVLCVANLSRFVQPVSLDLARFRGFTPIEMLGYTNFPVIEEHPYFLTLGPYGFCWFELQHPG
jgi:maltose alpha-D-glucosyltransferase/alpha-amylase